jgi:hypothetical protein
MPAFFLLNNKRAEIARLESEHGVQILILPDGRLRPDEYEFEMEGVREQPATAKSVQEPVSKDKEAKGSKSSDSSEAPPAGRSAGSLKPAANR